MIFKDYYKILDLKTNRVSLEEIKIAYRAAAKKYHPDVNVGDTLAEERIKDINEAYRVLSDSTSKRKYDRIWNSSVGRQKNKSEYDKKLEESISKNIFHMFFGDIKEKEENKEKNLKAKRGEDIQTEIKITIEEAFYGLKKKVSLKTFEGNVRRLDISIPEGIRDGEKIRLIGQGKQGKNGGKNGDLFIKINIESNEKFKLRGTDIYTELLISPWEAALGTRLQVDSIDENAQIFIPKGIQTGEKIKIPGKGYKIGNGERGNLIAEIKIVMPKNLTEEENNIFKKLKEISEFNPRGKKEFT